MSSDAGAVGEWSLYWTSRGRQVPCRLVPMLSGWADLDQREVAADIGERDPILIDPEYTVDPLLIRFFARSRFTWLVEGTREAYAKDYRLFFSFLWQRGKYWHQAESDDLLDWESWRRRDGAVSDVLVDERGLSGVTAGSEGELGPRRSAGAVAGC